MQGPASQSLLLTGVTAPLLVLATSLLWGQLALGETRPRVQPTAAVAKTAPAPPCWSDLARHHPSTVALPAFMRAMKHKACRPLTAKRDRGTDARITRGVLPAGPSNSLTANRKWFVKLPRGAKPAEGIDHVTVTNYRGEALRSRKALKLVRYVTKEKETIRSVAYRAASSPEAVAHINGLEWDPAGVPLPPGLTLRVPMRFRAASGFADAVRLTTGPGVLARRANTGWGRPYVVRLLQDTFHAMHRRWPNRHPAIAHDLSRLGGGSLRPHKSHRAGRDIDVGYLTRDRERSGWGRPSLNDIDYARLWFVIDRLERSGRLAAVYMSPAIQRRLYRFAVDRAGADPERLEPMFQYPAAKGAKRTLIRHSPGHRDHIHMRFDSATDVDELVLSS